MKKKYTLSAGAVIVREFDGQPRYLLVRAYDYWDFPKGMVEPGEEPFDTAKREVLEETGLDGLRFPWGRGFQETAPYGRGKIARYYIAESQHGEVYLPISPTLGRPEHEEFRWVDFDEAYRLLAPRLKAVLNWADWLIQHARGNDDGPSSAA